jgi:lactoylglutathione lyase
LSILKTRKVFHTIKYLNFLLKGGEKMKLGAFSVSLTVKDIEVSKAFYEKLGFQALGGDLSQNWLIMKNENCIIGLFQGMFEKNILTFNPGWNENAENLESFTDVRELQKQLKANGIKFLSEADETSEGPAHFMIEDPDGNQILLDQHR